MVRVATGIVSEKEFQAQVVELAKLYKWSVYHTFDSRRSTEGFPDLIMLRGEQMLAVELKSESGQPTVEQIRWLEAFREVREVKSLLWRPNDWDSITHTMARRR